MGFPAQIDRTDLHFPDDDNISHFAAREFQIALRILAVIAIVGTAVLMALFPFWGWIPGVLVLALAYLGLFISGSIEQRTRRAKYEHPAKAHRAELAHQVHDEADTQIEANLMAEDDEHFTSPKLLKREGVIGIEILIGLGLAAVALVVVGLWKDVIPWGLAATALGFIVAYGFFVMAPVWLGWFTDEEEQALGTLSNERVKPQIQR
jgi:hypothetical protein